MNNFLFSSKLVMKSFVSVLLGKSRWILRWNIEKRIMQKRLRRETIVL